MAPLRVHDDLESASSPAVHEHAWEVESRHATSDGLVLYVRCASCGIRRVDVQSHWQQPPTALSAEVGL